MDEYLRGKPGMRVMRRNVKGVIDGVVREEPPKPGANVYLTIDARIQTIAEEALRAVGRGAAVVVDPNNGNILAMASVPSFDPNTFIPSIKAKDWEALRQDEAKPLVNRAVSAFPPGSTFKIVTALAGVRKGLANKRFTCTGGVTYGDHYFQCWIGEKGGSHGTLSVSPTRSRFPATAFFYQYGNAAGIDAIDETGESSASANRPASKSPANRAESCPARSGCGSTARRKNGRRPTPPTSRSARATTWSTPLQMAMAYATVANGGIAYYPRLVDKVLNQDGTPVLDAEGHVAVPQTARVRNDLRNDFTPEQIELVRRGLWKVVNEDGGTGRVARLEGVEVAGKTGTAQAMRKGEKDTIAWFCCFAPFDHPRYAIAVMVQGGLHGGSVAAPIATRILERTLAMDKGEFEPQLAWVAPARKDDPFKMIPAVKYKDTLADAEGSDEENADDSQAAEKPEMAQSGGEPDVEPEADARGKVKNVASQPKRVPRAQAVATPAAPPQKPRNFFQRMFGGNRPAPTPTPRPVRRAQPAP